MKIMVLNGPNLNMLGYRDSKHYGTTTLSGIESELRNICIENGYELDFRQSNFEGEIINYIQELIINNKDYLGLIINPAAYTHTSIAIADSLEMLDLPIYEVHLSDINSREDFRKHSYTAKFATEIISGKGKDSYVLALQNLVYSRKKLLTESLA